MPTAPNIVTPPPGPRSRELIARGQFDMQSIYRALVFDDARSEGVWLVDVDGNTYLDLFSSFALGALGYNHPAIRGVIASDEYQRAAANPSSTPFLTTESWIDYSAELEARFAPIGMAKFFAVDGGGEGVEAAMKAAFIRFGEDRRASVGAPRNPLEMSAADQGMVMDNAGTDAVIVSFSGAFHGRGLGPLSATHSKLLHKADLPAFPWPQVPFPANRFPLDEHAEHNAVMEARSLQALDKVLDEYAGRVAAILIEPLQSEGGDRHASAAFYRAVQQRAIQSGASLIFDEVQTGAGLTGTLWAHEAFALPTPPDLVTFGKKMQLGGFFANDRHDIRQFGRMYQTRNGDRARALIGLATLRETVKLLPRVQEVGAAFLAGLMDLQARHPHLIREARGRGFALAFDLPTPAARDEFNRRALQKGVFATYTGSNSVRLRPHLITDESHVSLALSTFDAVCREMGG